MVAASAQLQRSHQAAIKQPSKHAHATILCPIGLILPCFGQAVQALDPASCMMMGAYYHSPESMAEGELGNGMVTLLGDAAHSM